MFCAFKMGIIKTSSSKLAEKDDIVFVNGKSRGRAVQEQIDAGI